MVMLIIRQDLFLGKPHIVKATTTLDKIIASAGNSTH